MSNDASSSAPQSNIDVVERRLSGDAPDRCAILALMNLPEPRAKPGVYNRDTLYAEVWAEPVANVAKRYGVSGVAIAKACSKLGVPVPARGYWAKRAAGQTPKRPPLPPPAADQRAALHFGPTVPPRTVSERESESVVHERADEQRIAVPDELRSPHPLVAATLKAFRDAKPDGNGILVPNRSRRPLTISVSQATQNRALCIMDALLHALDARGYPVTVVAQEQPYGYPTKHATQVRVGADTFDLALREKLREIKRPDPPAAKKNSRVTLSFSDRRLRHEPSGELELYIPGCSSRVRSRFADSPKRPLEALLNEVIVSLVRLGEDAIAERAANRQREIEDALRRQQEAERQRVLEEQRERAAREAERVKHLNYEVAQWQRAKNIREFVAAMRDAVTRGGCEVTPGGALELEFAWMLEQADAVDPVAKLHANALAKVKAGRERIAAIAAASKVTLLSDPEDPDAA